MMKDFVRRFFLVFSFLWLPVVIVAGVSGRHPGAVAASLIAIGTVNAALNPACLADWTRGLITSFRDLAEFMRPEVPAAIAPVPVRREPRHPRTGLDPAAPSNAHLLDTCPVCGIEDAGRFELGIAAAAWNGWNAHEYCVAWLDGPSSANEPARPAPVASHHEAIRRFRAAEAARGSSLAICEDLVDILAKSYSGEEAAWQYNLCHPPRHLIQEGIAPAGGMYVRGWLVGREWAVRLRAADPAWPRTDVIIRSGAGIDLIEGDRSALSPVLPADADVIAVIFVPAGCTQIWPGFVSRLVPVAGSLAGRPATAEICVQEHADLAVLCHRRHRD